MFKCEMLLEQTLTNILAWWNHGNSDGGQCRNGPKVSMVVALTKEQFWRCMCGTPVLSGFAINLRTFPRRWGLLSAEVRGFPEPALELFPEPRSLSQIYHRRKSDVAGPFENASEIAVTFSSRV